MRNSGRKKKKKKKEWLQDNTKQASIARFLECSVTEK